MVEGAAADVFRLVDPEVWVITSASGARRGGLVATTLMSISIVPELPRVAVTLAKHHATWELVESSRSFAAHLIAEDQIDWVRRFGMQTGRETDKFAAIAHQIGRTGSPILQDSAGWLECRVETSVDTGDRTLYIAEVIAAERRRDAEPLRMQRLMQMIPEKWRAKMKQDLEDDGRIDAAAIREWRSRMAIPAWVGRSEGRETKSDPD